MIGHASIDENGKIAGGKAGDSTKKEVCKRSWYNGNWHTVLRPKSSTIAEKAAKACEAACANNNIGYDQNQRNTLYTQAKAAGFDLSQIKTPCECDCSSLMHVCAIAGGAKLTYGSNGVTTRTMVQAFINSGDYEKLTDSKYLTSDKYLKRGDVLVKTGHTVMQLDNGSAIEEKPPATEEKPSATVTTPEKWTPKVGDVVNFTGSRHYISAYTGTGYKCKPGKARITSIRKGAPHPYHLIKVAGGSSTVYGWVDDGTFTKA